MKNYIIRVIAGICALMFMLINYACDDILPMCGASLSSFIIHMVIVPFLNQLVNQMEKFIFVRQEIYLLQEQNIGQLDISLV